MHKIVIPVTIHDAGPRRQNFGMVSNAFVRIVNEEGGKEVARYDLSEDASTETAMIFAEIYRARHRMEVPGGGSRIQGRARAAREEPRRQRLTRLARVLDEDAGRAVLAQRGGNLAAVLGAIS